MKLISSLTKPTPKKENVQLYLKDEEPNIYGTGILEVEPVIITGAT